MKNLCGTPGVRTRALRTRQHLSQMRRLFHHSDRVRTPGVPQRFFTIFLNTFQNDTIKSKSKIYHFNLVFLGRLTYFVPSHSIQFIQFKKKKDKIAGGKHDGWEEKVQLVLCWKHIQTKIEKKQLTRSSVPG